MPVKTIRARPHTVLTVDLPRHLLRGHLRGRAGGVGESGCEVLCGKLLVRNGLGAGAGFVDHVAWGVSVSKSRKAQVGAHTPKALVSKERHHYRRKALRQTNCSRPGAAVVHDSRDASVREEPVVRDVAQNEDIRRNGNATETALQCK